jgi:putative flippase GtrA
VQKVISLKASAKQFSIFIIGGVLSALVDVIVTKALLIVGMWYVAAISVGFVIGLCVNFIYNAKITFSVGLKRAVLVRYLTIVVANYLLTLLVVVTFVHLGGGSVMFGKILSLPLIAVHSYMWSKLWIYKSSKG